LAPIPRAIFDTTAINQITDDPEGCERLLSAIRSSALAVQVSAMNIDEDLIDKESRAQGGITFPVFRPLGHGICIWPPHWIIVRLPLREAHAEDSLVAPMSPDVGITDGVARLDNGNRLGGRIQVARSNCLSGGLNDVRSHLKPG
jgi:hypothetical protein